MCRRRVVIRCITLLGAFLSCCGMLYATGAQDKEPEKVELVVLCHQVHKTAMEGVANGGKNLVNAFLQANPNVTKVNFLTAGTPEVREKLFREAALPTTQIDVSMLYSPWISPNVPNFFEPLNQHMRQAPLEDPEDIFESARKALIIDSKSYGVPMRMSANILFFNKSIVQERGLPSSYSTIEEVIDAMKKCAFTRANGEQVYGLSRQGNKDEIVNTIGELIRTKNGDILTLDFKSTLTDKRVVEFVKLFKELLDAKALPSNFMSFSNADSIELFKNNRAGFSYKGPEYVVQFTMNSKLQEKDIGFQNLPSSKEYKKQLPEAAATDLFQWAFVIPKGALHKKSSWEFVRFMSSKDAILNMSLSGNSPVRISTLNNEEYTKRVPYEKEMLTAFKWGRPFYPGFDTYAEVNAIIGEEMQQVLMGSKTAEAAMADAEKKIVPLMPKK